MALAFAASSTPPEPDASPPCISPLPVKCVWAACLAPRWTPIIAGGSRTSSWMRRARPLRFSIPRMRRRIMPGDWYGEHAGKWLYAASKAAARTQRCKAARASNARRRLSRGSAGRDRATSATIAPIHRFTHKQPRSAVTWDGAPSVRTWDIWTHSYLILGLLEVHRHFPSPRYLEAARRIGDLCWQTLTEGGIDITDLGNHHGMSATVLMDPAVELYFATGERRYLDLALLVLEQAERNPRLALLSQALAAVDASEIGTGQGISALLESGGPREASSRDGRCALPAGVDQSVAEYSRASPDARGRAVGRCRAPLA